MCHTPLRSVRRRRGNRVTNSVRNDTSEEAAGLAPCGRSRAGGGRGDECADCAPMREQAAIGRHRRQRRRRVPRNPRPTAHCDRHKRRQATWKCSVLGFGLAGAVQGVGRTDRSAEGISCACPLRPCTAVNYAYRSTLCALPRFMQSYQRNRPLSVLQKRQGCCHRRARPQVCPSAVSGRAAANGLA